MLWSCGVGEDLKSPLDNKEIKPVNPKGYQRWIFIGRTDAEAEAPILWPSEVSWLIEKDPDAGKDWRQKEKGTAEYEMVDGITDSLDLSVSKLWDIVKDRKSGMLQPMGLQRVRHDWSNWTTTNQWLRLCAFTTGGTDLIFDWGTKIAHAMGRAKQTPPPPQQNKKKSLFP